MHKFCCGLTTLSFSLLCLTGCAHELPANGSVVEQAKHVSVAVPETVARSLDLQTAVAEQRSLVIQKVLTARIEPDIGKEIDVSSRVNGRVDELFVEPGACVHKGQVVAVLTSKDVSALEAKLMEARAKLMTARAYEERERQAYKEQVHTPKTLLDANSAVRTAESRLHLMQSQYNRQKALVEEGIGARKELLTAKAALDEAQIALELARTTLKREEALYENKSILKAPYQAAQSEAIRAEQEVEALMVQLRFLGVDSNSNNDKGELTGQVRITAPGDGQVTLFDIGPGEMVAAEKPLFRITDLSTALIEADVPEAIVHTVKLRDQLTVKVPGLKEPIAASVNFIGDHVDPQTRTVKVRARFRNSMGSIKIGMFAEVILAADHIFVLAVPRAAIQEIDGLKCVFVHDSLGFHKRTVQVGTETEDYAEIKLGLKPQEEVCTQGSLMLKAELTYRH
ncbi:MAG TPA: efflux RND transporter periplasmic adaptor subunit [Oculatellaceae cyanobacterium]